MASSASTWRRLTSRALSFPPPSPSEGSWRHSAPARRPRSLILVRSSRRGCAGTPPRRRGCSPSGGDASSGPWGCASSCGWPWSGPAPARAACPWSATGRPGAGRAEAAAAPWPRGARPPGRGGRVVLVQRRRRVGVVVVGLGRPAQRRHVERRFGYVVPLRRRRAGAEVLLDEAAEGGRQVLGGGGLGSEHVGRRWLLGMRSAVGKRGARCAVAAGAGAPARPRPRPAAGPGHRRPQCSLFCGTPTRALRRRCPGPAAGRGRGAASPGRDSPSPPRRARRAPANRRPHSQQPAAATCAAQPHLRARPRPLWRARRRGALLPRPAFRPPPARSLAAARRRRRLAQPKRGRAAFLARAAELAAKDWPGGPPDAVRNFMLKMPTADGYAQITGDGVVWRRDILYTYGGGITLTHTEPTAPSSSATTLVAAALPRPRGAAAHAAPHDQAAAAQRGVRRRPRRPALRWQARTRNLRVFGLRLELGSYR